MEPRIIYEDEEILVIDKPSGFIVNEAVSAKGQNILQNWLKKFDYPLATSREYRSGIVHRLDKETSGVLVVAKTKKSFEELQRQFKAREVKKSYLTLVHGRVEKKEGEIEATVGRLPWRKDRFGVLPGGRDAKTFYKVIANYQKEEDTFSLIEAFPLTGRTHQIRVHFKYLGHPIVADEFYAGRKTSRKDRAWCPRLFLHAQTLEVNHPTLGKRMKLLSELSADLSNVLDTLEKVREKN